jgi:glutamine synthetase
MLITSWSGVQVPQPLPLVLKDIAITALETLLARFAKDYEMIPVFGMEVEWTLLQNGGTAVTDALRETYLHLFTQETSFLPLHSASKEKGRGQVEAALLHTSDVSALIRDDMVLRNVAHQTAQTLGIKACFAAKPFADDYGNGLHVHLHLENLQGKKLFWKRNDELSPALSASLSGLLQTMQEHLGVFAGTPAAYARFVESYHAPITANWGWNNRTAALRIPDRVGHVHGVDTILALPPDPYRRIEHRVASSEASLEAVFVAILSGIVRGLEHPNPLPLPTYGNTSRTNNSELDFGITT